MAINYRVAGIEIKSFRGVPSLKVDFPSGSTATVVIGPNNSGKSTLLDAIALALNGPSSYNYAPEPFDFFHRSDRSIDKGFEIRARFAADSELQLPAVRGGIGNPTLVHGVCVIGSADKQGRLQHRSALVDSAGEQIVLPSGVPLQGEVKEQFREHGVNYTRRYARWSDISDHRPEVWLLRPDNNLYVSLYQWKTGPLQRLAKLLSKQFFGAKWEVEIEGKVRKMPEAMKAGHRFFTTAIREFPFWKDELKPRLEATLSGYIGRQAGMQLSPSLQAIEDWLADQLVMAFSADSGSAATPLEKMGAGWQSLVRIACLEVLTEYPSEVANRVVLLFEEPESFLHPHLARKLRGVLDRLASMGWTVVVTTHSPNLVSFSSEQQVIRLQKMGDDLIVKSLSVSDVDGAAKFQERVDERGAHEMLFARKIVLCEGQDDVFAVKGYLEKRKAIDLDGLSVSIVRTGDVNQLPAFAEMAKRLGIRWCAVSDQDLLRDGSIKPATARARERLQQHLTDSDLSVCWSGDLEHCVGRSQGKADPEWQAKAIEPKSNEDLQKDNPKFVATCEEIARWVLQQ